MSWKKMGCIFDPHIHRATWYQSHAALPIAVHLDGNVYRVYFSGRDDAGRAQIGYFDLDIAHPETILQISPEPVVRFGDLGTFDDRGVTAACLVRHHTGDYLYYSGWHLGVTVPFYFFIGLSIKHPGSDHFQKVSSAPVMERHAVDPYLLGSPYILIENDLWRMWYISAVKWKQIDNSTRHYYLVKYAESKDGINWERNGHICIDFASEDEYAIARPCVLKDGEQYRMWHAYRGNTYRIGYAESFDGLHWQRMDEQAGIEISENGWDSEMIEYPYVFDHQGQRYMLYNGNGYGKSGIGLAVWEEK